MRTERVKVDGAAYYHVMNRVLERLHILNGELTVNFRLLMRRIESFSGGEMVVKGKSDRLQFERQGDRLYGLITNKYPAFILALAMIGMSGCATKGPTYSQVQGSRPITPDNGRAMIVLYRPASFVGAGSLMHVFVNDEYIGFEGQPLRSGTYITYNAAPGQYTFKIDHWDPYSVTPVHWMDSNGRELDEQGKVIPQPDLRTLGGRFGGLSKIILHVQPGNVYYIERYHNAWLGPKLTQVSKEECETKIQGCHLQNSSCPIRIPLGK